ncbi:MAG TPA: hypothetical protein VMJ11_15440 [Paraburkholderia sp.]|uniref:hypothetical protein n=1 Tax=Paraburkholderia sp. TaxID=1926495 RepID=UPI002B687E6B|nr:hypothetical protein [Paraburkholderia sp.]HTR08010.1 hypothetical protein [Paraburkholderia sp.]
MSNAASLQLEPATLADEYDRPGTHRFNHSLQRVDTLGAAEGGCAQQRAQARLADALEASRRPRGLQLTRRSRLVAEHKPVAH